MIIVKYSDDSKQEYKDVEEAETGILEVFAGSDNEATPINIEEYDEELVFVREYRCQWSVELQGDEDED